MNDDQPAFPTTPSNGRGLVGQGMTLRHYFMAHAPVEPQPWFTPVMPKCPKHPIWDKATSNIEENRDYKHWRDGCYPLTVKVQLYAEQYYKAETEARNWNLEKLKQGYIQWPAAWADEQIKICAKQGGAA